MFPIFFLSLRSEEYRQPFVSPTKTPDIMTNISEITLLIAVVALALWPVILFALRFLNIRRRRLEHIERLTMNEEQQICFKYQGEDFYIAAEEENRFIMIWNPWWGCINADNEAFPILKEIINLSNVKSIVTTVYMADEDGKTIGLHSHCHTYFSPNEGELEEHMKMLLDFFFDIHNFIKDNMNQIGTEEIGEEEKKERVKVKGFAAYKENTVPLKSDTATAAQTGTGKEQPAARHTAHAE